jgi:hypothetical protein
MSFTSREMGRLLDYVFGDSSNAERVRLFWYSPKDSLNEAIETLELAISQEEINSIALVMTESVRLATTQSITQRKRSEQRVERSIRSMKSAFQVQIVMHNVMFYLGVSLIVTAVVCAFQGNSLASLVIGGIGIFDLAIFLIKKPVEGLHESVGNLLQLRAAYNAFFAQLDQWQLYFENLSGAQFLETKHQITNLMQHSTENTVQLIHDYTNSEEPDSEKSRISSFFERLRSKKKENSNINSGEPV